MTPTPSLRMNPLLLASANLHRASGASILALEKPMLISGTSTRFTPPARARLDSRAQRLWQARCTATSEDEQAVSTVRLGPWRSRRYESRPATTLLMVPVTLFASDEGLPIWST